MSTGMNINLDDLGKSIVKKVGKIAAKNLYKRLFVVPKSIKDSREYYDSIRITTIQHLNSVENQIQDNLSLLMDKGKHDQFDLLENINKKIRNLKKEMDKTISFVSSTENYPIKTYRSLAAIFLTLQYESSVIIHVANEIENSLYDGEDISNKIKEMRNQIQNLENTNSLKNQALSDPSMADSIYDTLKKTRSEWMEFLDQSFKASRNELEQLVSGVELSKPKIFGKKGYTTELANLIWTYANNIKLDKIEMPELALKLRNENQKIEFNDQDLENSIIELIDNNRAFSLIIENNIKAVEFRKSDKSVICGNCGKSGGIYPEFRRCQNKNVFVCTECFSTFGKCKVCGKKDKDKHPLLK